MSASRKLLIPASRLFSAASSSRSAKVTRALSTSSALNAITKFTMPAMSPTMTSGGIAAWKIKEGQTFSAGDVLLEIETDKATMDVEAQDDGVLAKIVVQDGSKDVEVGKTIAMLAEEGDDISNVEVPKDEAAPSTSPAEDKSAQQSDKSAPQPSTQTAASTGSAAPSTPGASSSNAHHSFKGPLFPSVQRLIAENGIEDAETKIKGTGVRGMITKGDVLAFLGKAQSPTGSFKEPKGGIAVLGPSQAFPKGSAASGTASKTPQEPLTGDALRSLIIGGLAALSRSALKAAPASTPVLPAQAFAQQALDNASEASTFSSTPAPKSVRSGATRKEGIRSDDPLWDLI
ncbi:related to pyruvate dehydrogenase complex protein X precursor, dihydrolipoamide acetyltransferase component [Melanopsichium pennsylvanicum]|uniref:Related to pyruvate dehydrogenase complex protein X, dihydrolipoamide acetyltransferase component n=2 Tax=Melanopsichium pennsylvanicum TaxID=63383 RepID=A0AAJ4XGC6_9BASI|nr:related to pyruvate dehydrogenase complex protein X precursor, dihydrolipoamide acetyltransferase component [Melanopsichium pennsylvanicum 4]SNX81576.1 related to pyruvate dehydrogenase complex protein X precursor, dihydrolipoamide acetyltransferase component [Melanopsichium pennsylvanicum]